MKNAPFIKAGLFVFVVFAGLAPFFCHAENIFLGNVPEEVYLQKIPDRINLDINGKSYTLAKSDLTKWLNEKTDLKYSANYKSEIENPAYCLYKKSLICNLSFPFREQNNIRKISDLSFDQNALSDFVKNLAATSDQDPSDARLKMDNGKVSVFSLSSAGIKLDQEKSVAMIGKFLVSGNYSDKITLPFEKLNPEVYTDSIDNMGITSLIGEGKSNFAGSPKNRIHNIQTAIARFNGLLIKPNEDFSFVGALGEVDGDHGYLPELVIKQNKTELDFGGGICQVSTTAFRAAIYSGLQITARTNHAYPVGYYNPQGMDATVFIPKPDLKFINNTPGYILMQTHIEGTILFFDFYGTDDGRKTNIIGPTITEKNPDGSMKAEFTQQVLDKDGNIVRTDVIKSAYKSPSLYPHPGEVITEKPADWSQKEWNKYKKEHNI